ncbi:MAG: sporulation initiation factor Spo0A C-terminal domain-containing protein [Niameybacter sp.]
MTNLATKIEDILLDIGVPTNLLGHKYTVCATALHYINAKDHRISMTKFLYPTIAEMFKTTPTRVERAIRHAIEMSFDKIDITVCKKYFGSIIDPKVKKPTNSEFIATLSMHVERIARGDMEETND